MKVFVFDGGRHLQGTGYGRVARSVISAVASTANVTYVSMPAGKVDSGTLEENITPWSDERFPKDADFVIQVGPPSSMRTWPVPCIAYTMVDVDGLSKSWIEQMKGISAVVTPSESSKKAFERHLRVPVRIAPLYVRNPPFKPQARWRPEGAEKFSFIYVGTFCFRKGVDILLPAFIREFDRSEAMLTLFCSESDADRAFNYVISEMARQNKVSDIRFITKPLSDEWLARTYNRHDAFVTFTRGEGWGYPALEAAMCGLPVIATARTSMDDFLIASSTIFAMSEPCLVDAIDTEFGENFRNSYIGNDLSYRSTSVKTAQLALRGAVESFERLEREAVRASKAYESALNESSFSSTFSLVLQDLLSCTGIHVADIGSVSVPEDLSEATRRAEAKQRDESTSSASLLHMYDERYYLQEAPGGNLIQEAVFDLRRYTNIFRAYSLSMPRTAKSALDIGCGRGELGKQLLSDGLDVTLVDYSPVAMDIARAFIGEADKCRYVVGNACELDGEIESRSQDIVFLTDVVEHVSPEELNLILRAASRVLKEQGRLIVHTPEKYSGSVLTKKAVDPRHINLMEIEDLERVLDSHFAFVEAFTWNGVENFSDRGSCIELFGYASHSPLECVGLELNGALSCVEPSQSWATISEGPLRQLADFWIEFDFSVRGEGAGSVQVLMVDRGAPKERYAWVGFRLDHLRSNPTRIRLPSSLFKPTREHWREFSELGLVARMRVESGSMSVEIRNAQLRIP